MAVRDPAKERRWREIIANWQASEISIAEFCRLNDFDYKSFCNWRKIIRNRDLGPVQAHGTKDKLTKRRAVRATHVAPRKSGTPRRIDAHAEPRRESRSVEFAEVKVLDVAVPANLKPSPGLGTSLLEIVLPGGITLRPGVDCPMSLLSSVIAALEKH